MYITIFRASWKNNFDLQGINHLLTAQKQWRSSKVSTPQLTPPSHGHQRRHWRAIPQCCLQWDCGKGHNADQSQGSAWPPSAACHIASFLTQSKRLWRTAAFKSVLFLMVYPPCFHFLQLLNFNKEKKIPQVKQCKIFISGCTSVSNWCCLCEV